MKILVTKIKEKTNELRRHINKNMIIMLTGNLLTILINIATIKILTNKFSTEDFGVYSLIIAFAILPQLVLFAPIAASIFPFIKNKKDENRYNDFQKNLFDLFFLIAASLLIFLLIALLINIIFQIIPNELIYLGLFSLFFSSTLSWLALLDTFSLANHRVKTYTIFPLINLISKMIILIVIYKVDIIPQTLIVIFSVIQFALCFIELFYLKKNGTITHSIRLKFDEVFSIRNQGKKEIINYSKNFFLWGLFAWGQTFFDKWILHHYIGSTSVAIYAVYYQYGFVPFTIFSSIISQYITPIYFSKNAEDMRSFLQKLLYYCVFFLLVSGAVMVVMAFYLAPFFIRILTNVHYLEYINLFPIIVLAGCFYGFGQILTVPMLSSDSVGRIRFPKIATAIISMVLFWILVPRFGLSGILYSLLLSNIFYFISLLLINRAYMEILKTRLINNESFK